MKKSISGKNEKSNIGKLNREKLKIEDLSVSLSGNDILKGLSLEMSAGEFVSLLGPSGSGKTTLLKTIAGIIEQSEGTISLSGRIIDKLPAHKRGAVIVFQDIRLFPHLTILENVAYSLRMQGMSAKEYRPLAQELLDRVQLSSLEDRKPNQLSGGQQQRVALARALAAKPEILLLDEPFSSLDTSLRADMRRLVLDLHEEFAMTTIMVTHDKTEALAMSDRIIILDEGKILQIGSPEEVYLRPESLAVAKFFDDGDLIPGQVRTGVFTCPLFAMDSPHLPDGPYLALVRPYALESAEGTGYELLEEIYAGDRIEARYEHLASGESLGLTIALDSDYKLEKTCNISFKTDNITLIKG